MKMSLNPEDTERGGARTPVTSPATLFTSEDQKNRGVRSIQQSLDDSVIEDVINRLESEDFQLRNKNRNFRERSSSSMSEVELELEGADQDDVISDLVADAYAAAGRMRR